LHDVSKLRSGEREILKSADDASVKGLVLEGKSGSSKGFGLSVDGRGRRFATEHPGVVGNILGILLLV
jgi:hypothetical protein